MNFHAHKSILGVFSIVEMSTSHRSRDEHVGVHLTTRRQPVESWLHSHAAQVPKQGREKKVVFDLEVIFCTKKSHKNRVSVVFSDYQSRRHSTLSSIDDTEWSHNDFELYETSTQLIWHLRLQVTTEDCFVYC